jgi:hypothetical protein
MLCSCTCDSLSISISLWEREKSSELCRRERERGWCIGSSVQQVQSLNKRERERWRRDRERGGGIMHERGVYWESLEASRMWALACTHVWQCTSLDACPVASQHPYAQSQRERTPVPLSHACTGQMGCLIVPAGPPRPCTPSCRWLLQRPVKCVMVDDNSYGILGGEMISYYFRKDLYTRTYVLGVNIYSSTFAIISS